MLRKISQSQASVVHASNPSYSGGRDQEDQSQTGQLVQESLSR
jgi:hypothetical protein